MTRTDPRNRRLRAVVLSGILVLSIFAGAAPLGTLTVSGQTTETETSTPTTTQPSTATPTTTSTPTSTDTPTTTSTTSESSGVQQTSSSDGGSILSGSGTVNLTTEWFEYSDNPVHDPGKAYYPSVIKDEGSYLMWYSSNAGITMAQSNRWRRLAGPRGRDRPLVRGPPRGRQEDRGTVPHLVLGSEYRPVLDRGHQDRDEQRRPHVEQRSGDHTSGINGRRGRE